MSTKIPAAISAIVRAGIGRNGSRKDVAETGGASGTDGRGNETEGSLLTPRSSGTALVSSRPPGDLL
ncbi:hypothetical protein GCM10010428_57360 [Actinosynnema pretiosum subsp. pretiosum]